MKRLDYFLHNISIYSIIKISKFKCQPVQILVQYTSVYWNCFNVYVLGWGREKNIHIRLGELQNGVEWRMASMCWGCKDGVCSNKLMEWIKDQILSINSDNSSECATCWTKVPVWWPQRLHTSDDMMLITPYNGFILLTKTNQTLCPCADENYLFKLHSNEKTRLLFTQYQYIFNYQNIQVQVPASSDTCTVYICLLELF